MDDVDRGFCGPRLLCLSRVKEERCWPRSRLIQTHNWISERPPREAVLLFWANLVAVRESGFLSNTSSLSSTTLRHRPRRIGFAWLAHEAEPHCGMPLLDSDAQCRQALSSGTKPAFLKLNSDLHRTAPNYPTGSESSCTVEGQIKRAGNGCRAHHYEASSKYGDVLHYAIGAASLSK